jgi:hypothetical protein
MLAKGAPPSPSNVNIDRSEATETRLLQVNELTGDQETQANGSVMVRATGLPRVNRQLA